MSVSAQALTTTVAGAEAIAAAVATAAVATTAKIGMLASQRLDTSILSPSTCHHAQAAVLLARILTVQAAIDYHKDVILMRAIGGALCAACCVVLDVHAYYVQRI
eukprot:3382-Heterococcus_DN1.PRE.2